MNNYIDIRIP